MFAKTDQSFGVNEVLLASVLGAVVFAIAAAQPLVIVGVTGKHVRWSVPSAMEPAARRESLKSFVVTELYEITTLESYKSAMADTNFPAFPLLTPAF